MSIFCEFYRTTIGKKIVMAFSGLVLVGFVVGHMLGNLKVFLGFDMTHRDYAIDIYGEHLRTMGEGIFGHGGFLWIVRSVLLSAVVLHVISAVQLAITNRAGKPVKNAKTWYGSSSAASRTMMYGGLFLIFFISFHILHLTTGTVHYRGFVEGEVYANLWFGFKSFPVATFYVLAMAALAMHLYHGFWSMFQTLGVDSPAWNGPIRTIAKLLAVILFLGFSSVPLAVAFDLLSPPIAL